MTSTSSDADEIRRQSGRTLDAIIALCVVGRERIGYRPANPLFCLCASIACFAAWFAVPSSTVTTVARPYSRSSTVSEPSATVPPSPTVDLRSDAAFWLSSARGRRARLHRIDCRYYEVAGETRSEIIELEVMPDHVHVLVEVDPQFGIHSLIKLMKGRSSRLLRQEFPWLKSRLPTLWTNSYFVSTVGGSPLAVVKQYIENQKRSEPR